MEFDTAKTLFAVGLILWIIISPIGLILTLIGAYGLSQHYRRRGIFWNLLCAVIMLPVIALVLLIALGPAALTTSSYVVYDTIRVQLQLPSVAFSIIAPIVLIFWTFFMRRAYMNLFEVSNVDSFKTTAKLILAGALILLAAILLSGAASLTITATPPTTALGLFIILFILGLLGIIVILVGHIFAIIGAFRLKPPT